MKNFFFFLAFTYSHFVSSQAVTFEKHYNFGGTNAGYCVQQTMDGGYIVAGVRTLGIGMEEMLLQKVDSLGQTQWIKFFSDGYESEASSVRQTADGGFILTGWTSIDISYHHYIALIKTDSNGDTVWTKRYDGSSLGPGSSCNCGREVAATSDGGYAIVAGMLDQADNLEKILLIKTNATGDTLWTKKYKGFFGVGAASIKQTSDGGFIMGGTALLTDTLPPLYSVFLLRTDANGDTIWTKAINVNSFNEYAYSVWQASDGGFFITGRICCPDSIYMGNILYIKTDSAGDTLWTKQIKGNRDDYANCGQETADGGYMMVGYTNSYSTGSNIKVYLLKTDMNGDTLWTKTFGGPNQSSGVYSVQTTDGGFIIGGMTSSFGTGDVYLIKTDGTGQIIGINDIPFNDIGIIVFPNPMNEAATVFLLNDLSNKKNLEFYLIDMLGKVVDREKVISGNDNFKINTSSMQSGIYLLQILSSSKTIRSEKIIVQH